MPEASAKLCRHPLENILLLNLQHQELCKLLALAHFVTPEGVGIASHLRQ